MDEIEQDFTDPGTHDNDQYTRLETYSHFSFVYILMTRFTVGLSV